VAAGLWLKTFSSVMAGLVPAISLRKARPCPP